MPYREFYVLAAFRLGSPQILICGESGGNGRTYDLAERYRFCDPFAERDADSRAALTPQTVHWTLLGAALSLHGRNTCQSVNNTLLGGGRSSRFNGRTLRVLLVPLYI